MWLGAEVNSGAEVTGVEVSGAEGGWDQVTRGRGGSGDRRVCKSCHARESSYTPHVTRSGSRKSWSGMQDDLSQISETND